MIAPGEKNTLGTCTMHSFKDLETAAIQSSSSLKRWLLEQWENCLF
jgi:hypothetical protein